MANANAYKVTTIAKAQAEAAPLIAEAVTLEGQAEFKMQEGFKLKRAHDENLGKINSIWEFSNNKNSVVFGNQEGNLLAQVEAFNMVEKKNH